MPADVMPADAYWVAALDRARPRPALTVVPIYLLGDGRRDKRDPRLKI